MIDTLRLSLAITVVLALATVSGPASACGAGKLLYEEKFTALPAWAPGPEKSAGPNGLTITENVANTTWFAGPPDGYANAEICVTLSAQGPETVGATAGLAFYFFNSENYYRAAISNIAGTFVVERRLLGQWTTVIPFSSAATIRRGATAENEISVKLIGSHALVSVNDKPVGRVRRLRRFRQREPAELRRSLLGVLCDRQPRVYLCVQEHADSRGAVAATRDPALPKRRV